MAASPLRALPVPVAAPVGQPVSGGTGCGCGSPSSGSTGHLPPGLRGAAVSSSPREGAAPSGCGCGCGCGGGAGGDGGGDGFRRLGGGGIKSGGGLLSGIIAGGGGIKQPVPISLGSGAQAGSAPSCPVGDPSFGANGTGDILDWARARVNSLVRFAPPLAQTLAGAPRAPLPGQPAAGQP